VSVRRLTLVLVDGTFEQRLAAVLARHDALLCIVEPADAVEVSVSGVELGDGRRRGRVVCRRVRAWFWRCT
jgi:hypothetical protein